MADHNGHPPARTVLEQKIRERNQTLEEFIDYVEKFRRDHHEPGTLSLRHLERLIAGHRGDGRPLGPLRPATARLLEHVLGQPIAALLAPPAVTTPDDTALDLRQRLAASCQVDATVIALFRDQLNTLRRLDRQLGAIVVYQEVHTKVAQVVALQAHSLLPGVRSDLISILAELQALAGWQALDRGNLTVAWAHHEQAKLAAREADSPVLWAHSLAQQAMCLIDLGDPQAAVDQLAEARRVAHPSSTALLRSWLAASHGEGLAAVGRRPEVLNAFDAAETLLPDDSTDPELPFLFLDGTHLARWRGHALAKIGDIHAVGVLAEALQRLEPSFIRAETTLRVDLAQAFMELGVREELRVQARIAGGLAIKIGSVRQQNRLRLLQADRWD